MWTALRITNRVDFEPELDAKFALHLIDYQEYFGVARGIGAPEDFDAELIELPVAPLLRTLATEHRARVVQALFRVAAIEASLYIRAHHAGSSLGAQRDGSFGVIAIVEGVHLLLDNVRGVAARARIEFYALHSRDSDFVEAVTLRNRAESLFNEAQRLGAGTDPILETAKSCEVLQS
jgi:hypothetical protein